MKSSEVRLESLCKEYGRMVAVDSVSLTIEPGHMIALLGPSGCGKTTCLRMIAGLIRPTSGDVFVNNQRITDVPVHRRNVGMLFQNYALFPHLTVEENIAFGLEMRGIAKADAAKKKWPQRSIWCSSPTSESGILPSSPVASNSASRWGGPW